MANERTKARELQVCEVVEVDGDRNCVMVKAEFVTTNEESGTERVSTRLAMCAVLCNGVTNIKYVHNYAVGEKVVCIFPETSYNPYSEYFKKLERKGYREADEPYALGYAVGTFYDEDNKPPVKYPEVQQITFAGGYIRYNGEDKEITIKCSGDFTINARGIYLNG